MQFWNNFLDRSQFDSLRSTVCGHDFPWRMRKNMTSETEENGGIWFVHTFYYNREARSPFYNDHIIPILDKLNASAIIEARANLYLSKLFERSDSHIDYPHRCKTGILYLNDCNGGTIINDTFIEAKANRFVEFDTSQHHYGVTSSNADARYIINMNYYKD